MYVRSSICWSCDIIRHLFLEIPVLSTVLSIAGETSFVRECIIMLVKALAERWWTGSK